MNILIENPETHQYLNLNGGWETDPQAGRGFRTSLAAMQLAKREAIGRFNIVGHIPQTNQFVNLDSGRGKGLPETNVG